VCFYDV